jgi:hypothetical protein
MYSNSKRQSPNLLLLWLLNLMYLVVSSSKLRNTANTTSTQNACPELGWGGTECLTPNYIPVAPGPNAYYNNSVYDPNMPISNWDGNKLRVEYKDHSGEITRSEFVFATALGPGGLPCWAYYSSAAIWELINGQYKFLSYFSTGTQAIDFRHNNQIRLQCATNPWRCALNVIAISMLDTSTNKLAFINPNPTAAMCKYKVPSGKYEQVSVNQYINLNATTEYDIGAEVVQILRNFKLVSMPGFNQPIPVNFAFNKTIIFRDLIHGLDPNSVNPDITRYSGANGYDNYAAHILGSDEKAYFAYWFRSCGTNKNRPSYERVKLYILSTDFFPWDPGAVFKYAYTLDRADTQSGNIEDQRTIITDNRMLFAVHATPCINPGTIAASCGLIRQFILRNQNNINVLDGNGYSGWGPYVQLYGQNIPGLADPTQRSQRPDLDVINGTLNAVCFSAQWPGKVANIKGVETYEGPHGASRYFCINVAP